MDVDGIDSSLSPVVAPRRRVHPCGFVALDALLGGDFPCRALSQVFLVSVPGLPMRSHVDYDFIGLLLATHSDRRIYIRPAVCAGSLERGVARHCSDLHDASAASICVSRGTLMVFGCAGLVCMPSVA